MNAEVESKAGRCEGGTCLFSCNEQLQQEFRHLKADWSWLLMFGILLTACGLTAVIFPALTVLTAFAAVVVLGVALMVAGIATIIAAFWAGKWSGMLVQLLVGILYLVVGLAITDTPLESAETMTLLLAAFFIVAGVFRMVAAMAVRFPYWGWSMLNGAITFLLGMVIYRHFPNGAIWMLGLLVGLEMFFHGWTWMLMALAIRKIPDAVA